MNCTSSFWILWTELYSSSKKVTFPTLAREHIFSQTCFHFDTWYHNTSFGGKYVSDFVTGNLQIEKEKEWGKENQLFDVRSTCVLTLKLAAEVLCHHRYWETKLAGKTFSTQIYSLNIYNWYIKTSKMFWKLLIHLTQHLRDDDGGLYGERCSSTRGI